EHRDAANTGPVENLKTAIQVLYQGRAAFDPVAIVAIENGIEPADFRLVDVTADDAIHAAPTRLLRDRRLEIIDIAQRVLDPALDVGRKRPIGVAEAPAPEVVPMVDGQEQGVGAIAEIG